MTKQAITIRTEQGIVEGKRPLVMKSGLVHWLTEKTATNIESMLAQQQAHGFIKITELGITINTADIGDGVLTIEKYVELQKQRRGLWKCEEGNWHERKMLQCTCRADRIKHDRSRREAEQKQQEYRELTPEEQERSLEHMRKSTEILVLRGVLPHAGRTIRRSTIEEFKGSGEVMEVSEDGIKIDEDVL